MQNASQTMAIRDAVATLTVQIERHLGTRLKRAMIAMLAGWLCYFALISMSVRTLNKVTVPFVGIPLGVLLVAQGTAVIFLATLVLLVKVSAANASR